MKKAFIIICAVIFCAALAAGSFLYSSTRAQGYTVRELWVENNGQKIFGEAYVPASGGKFPLIITSHGLGANHGSGASYARKYAPNGYAVYTFDFRGGSNKNNPNRSDGKTTEMSVMTEASDLEAVLAAAKTWDFVDTGRIFLQGGSQGGLVTAIAGVRHVDEVAGLILLYPAFGMYDFVHMYDYDEFPDEMEVGSMTVGKNFGQDLWKYDVREDLHTFTKPVIIIQGSADEIVLPSVTEAARDLYPDAEYCVIKGAGHGFSGEYHDEATRYALDFLKKHI